MQAKFLNLTNGIEKLPEIPTGEFVGFLRIESTRLEQKQFWRTLYDLDHTFLMNVAMGNECLVYDYSNKKNQPRAIFQGLEWIKFVLNHFWLSKEYQTNVKGLNTNKYFDCVLRNWNAPDYKKWWTLTMSKLDYYIHHRFVVTKEIRIKGIGQRTTHDGDYHFYEKIVEDYYCQ